MFAIELNVIDKERDYVENLIHPKGMELLM